MKLRGVLHMHSTYSYDGKVSLSDLKKLLQSNGIVFCCMSEHTDELTPEAAAAFVRECEELSDESFLFIPGFEVPYLPAPDSRQAGKDAHVLHFGCTKFLGQFADAEQLRQWREAAELVVLAHPVRNKFVVDATLAEVIDGVEIWNQQYEGKVAPRFRSMQLFEDLQKDKGNVIATGGIDLHRREHFGAPIIELEAEQLTVSNVLEVLKRGDFKSIGGSVVVSGLGKLLAGGGVITRLKSRLAIMTIDLGKFVNKVLAAVGISLPKSLRQFIRARV